VSVVQTVEGDGAAGTQTTERTGEVWLETVSNALHMNSCSGLESKMRCDGFSCE